MSGEVWTLQRLLQVTQQFLAARGIESARLDAELLLCQALGCDRVYLYTHYERPVDAAERDALRALVKRRAAHEPMAYLRGEQEFFGLSLGVGPGVLVPRPETEHLVEVALAYVRALRAHGIAVQQPLRLADVGCGSGAVAIALATELPEAEVWATDLSPQALSVAQQNVARHNLEGRVHVVAADLLTPTSAGMEQLPPRFDVIVSNPPYVAKDARLPRTVAAYEPPEALYSGPEGLDALRRLVALAPARLTRPGLLALEHSPEQAAALARTLAEAGALDHSLPDLSGRARIASGLWGAVPFALGAALGAGPFAAPPQVADGPPRAPVAGAATPDGAAEVQLDAPEFARD